MKLGASQLSVYYASYKHLAKVAATSAPRASSDAGVTQRHHTGLMICLGGWATLKLVNIICRRGGMDIDRADTFALNPQERLLAPTLAVSR